MSFEDEVKQAFKKHEDDARADGQSWSVVEKKVRRAHKQRLAYSSALSLVIIAAIAAVVTLSPRANESKGFSSPTATPTTSPSPSSSPSSSPQAPPSTGVPAGFKPRVGVQSGFAVDIPKDWKGGWFEGYWDFEPNGLPSTSEGGDTFALVINVEPGGYRDASGGANGIETTIGDHNAITWSTDPLHISYSVDWPGCPNYAPTCSSNFSTERLIMRLEGSTQSLWDSYKDLGQKAAMTVHKYDGSEPEHGTLDAGTKVDAFSKAIVRFMDARVEGVGAEDFMCCIAPRDYEQMGGLYQLNGNALLSYEVKLDGRPVAEPASVAFDITTQYAKATSSGEFVESGYESGKVNGAEVPLVRLACKAC